MARRLRLKLNLERFALLGRMLREERQPAQGRGLHCTAQAAEPRLAKPAKAEVSLKRAGWRGFPNSHNPHGAMTLRHQVKWIRVPVPVLVAHRPQSKAIGPKRALALTKIGQIPTEKLPRLPKKYAWQKD